MTDDSQPTEKALAVLWQRERLANRQMRDVCETNAFDESIAHTVHILARHAVRFLQEHSSPRPN